MTSFLRRMVLEILATGPAGAGEVEERFAVEVPHSAVSKLAFAQTVHDMILDRLVDRRSENGIIRDLWLTPEGYEALGA